MPRKAFVEDLQQVARNFSHPRLSEVAAGVEDGSLTLKYRLQMPIELDIIVQALVTGKLLCLIALPTAKSKTQTSAITLPRICT